MSRHQPIQWRGRFPRGAACSRRRAFTLAELLVSIGILIAMMAMVATIFATAGKSSGLAQSQAKLHRQLQQVVDAIRSDLESTFPSDGTLAIAGVEVDAPERSGETSYGHRADVLMLLTQRDFTPYIYQEVGYEQFANVKQVIYGHANIGQIDRDTEQWVAGSLRGVETGEIPAVEWHLARRVVGFSTNVDLHGQPNVASWPLVDSRLSGEAPDVSDLADLSNVAVDYGLTWDAFAGQLPSGVFKYRNDQRLYFTYTEAGEPFRYDPDNVSRGGAKYFFLKDGYWYGNADGGDVFVRTLSDGTQETAVGAFPWPAASGPAYWPEWFYMGGDTRVWLDPSPPAGQAARLASYFLPACSEFKVEFTYDDPSEIALGADTNPDTFEWDVDGDGSGDLVVPRPLPVRWETVPNGEQWVWSKVGIEGAGYGSDRIAPTVFTRGDTSPYRWPKGLRITIRAYDPAGNLDRSIEQVILHVWE